ncbi:UNVERIFIED_CONTAM: beta-galactosidase, partial [Prevotella sp. 15_C9]
LNSETPALKGEFKAGNGWQTIKLDKSVTGRYFAIQTESSQSGDSQIAIAEVYLQDAQGNRIDRNNWVAYYADSEKGNSTLDKMF